MHTTVCHQAMRVWVNSTSWCSSIPHQSVMSSSHSLWGFPPTPSICPNIIILTNLILQICPKRFNFLSITICTRLLSDSTQFLITVFVIFHCQPIWSAQLPVDNISSQKPRSAACPSSSESMIHMHTANPSCSSRPAHSWADLTAVSDGHVTLKPSLVTCQVMPHAPTGLLMCRQNVSRPAKLHQSHMSVTVSMSSVTTESEERQTITWQQQLSGFYIPLVT